MFISILIVTLHLYRILKHLVVSWQNVVCLLCSSCWIH